MSLLRSISSSFLKKKRFYTEVKWSRIPFQYEHLENTATKISKLPNGLRVVTHKLEGLTATVGLFVDSGSRAENGQNNGVAHFFEHMAFKGTNTMSQMEMETLVENLGTRLFAYTSREQTVYYGKCFGKDGPKIVEILSDIIQSPLLSDDAIGRERSVIRREMEDIETQVDEVVFDHLHSTAYQGTPLAYTILGPPDNIENISRDDLVSYIKRHYTAGRIVLIAVGDVDHEEYVQIANKHLSSLPPTNEADAIRWYEPAQYLGSGAYFRNDDMPYAYVALAYEGVPPTHRNFIPLMIANTYVGSWDQSCTHGKVMPSFLAQYSSVNDSIKTYSSFYACYKDTALWGIYYTGKRHQLDDFSYILGRQWKGLQRNLTDGAVTQAKNALKTAWLMQVDGTTPLFEEIGRQMLIYNRHLSNKEFEEAIDNCDTEMVEQALTELISGKCPAVVAMGPIEQMPDYMEIRSLSTALLH